MGRRAASVLEIPFGVLIPITGAWLFVGARHFPDLHSRSPPSRFLLCARIPGPCRPAFFEYFLDHLEFACTSNCAHGWILLEHAVSRAGFVTYYSFGLSSHFSALSVCLSPSYLPLTRRSSLRYAVHWVLGGSHLVSRIYQSPTTRSLVGETLGCFAKWIVV